jgi:hypothetical protein
MHQFPERGAFPALERSGNGSIELVRLVTTDEFVENQEEGQQRLDDAEPLLGSDSTFWNRHEHATPSRSSTGCMLGQIRIHCQIRPQEGGWSTEAPKPN